MTKILITLAFLLGTANGVWLSAIMVRKVSLETVAERAVKDVSVAYENTLNRSQVFEKFEAKFNDCIRQNMALNRKIWSLENRPK